MNYKERPKSTRKNVGLELCKAIGSYERRTHTANECYWSARKHTRWSWGKCLICGDNFHVLTNYHAQLHGYKNADAMCEDGKVKWRDEFEQFNAQTGKKQANC